MPGKPKLYQPALKADRAGADQLLVSSFGRSKPPDIINFVARGWESKSVEDQQALYAESKGNSEQKMSSAESAKRRVQDGLTLKRKHILNQLHSAQNPRHRAMLERSLSDLDAEIALILPIRGEV
ncbi:MAG: hypothetical protein ACRD2U_07665 [Terriglobales bacterium]